MSNLDPSESVKNSDTLSKSVRNPDSPVESVKNSDTLAPKGRYGGPIEELVKSVAAPLHLGNRDTAARMLADAFGTKLSARPPPAEYEVILATFLQYLLDNERYADAGTLLWPANLFTAEPRAVRLLFDAMFDNVSTMVQGAASMSKSYSLGVWMYLDWRRDPMYTSIQVLGPSENHLERNLFSHLVRLHKQASIPFAKAEVMKLGITTDQHLRSAGIFGVVIPLGKKASGRLQGVKVNMRPKPHPLFGPTSRLRVMLEEAENIPVGIWEDVTNIISNVGSSGRERFKIVAPFNPKDPNGPCAQRCEPIDGWNSIDVEIDETWRSKRGWQVVRLDAYKSENVLLGTEKYFGLQTKHGLELLIQNAGGVGSPGYYTMARGWFPPTGVDLAVVPQHLMNEVVGEYIFPSGYEVCGGVDIALEGDDTAIMCLGRTGRASGYRKPPTKDFPKGEVVEFKDAQGNRVGKNVIQLDNIFPLPKGDTTKLVAAIIDVCRGAKVNGAYLGIDRTGNGAGVHDILLRKYHGEVKGVNPSMSPTEKRILEEDSKIPSDEYAYLISELWFALRKYIEYTLLKIHSNVAQDPLFHEITGRRFLLTTAKTKVESKKEYKSRGNRSPDRADALTLMVHAVRMNLAGPPSATNTGVRATHTGPARQRISITDRMEDPL